MGLADVWKMRKELKDKVGFHQEEVSSGTIVWLLHVARVLVSMGIGPSELRTREASDVVLKETQRYVREHTLNEYESGVLGSYCVRENPSF